MSSVKLSIIIVCWHEQGVVIRDDITAAIRSVVEQTTETNYEILVSDNGSTDGSAELIEEEFADYNVRVIRNEVNLGFGRANNVAAEQAVGEYILLLNPDTVILDGALDKWMRYVAQETGYKVHGLRLLFGDGSYQISGRPFPTVARTWLATFALNFPGRLFSDWNTHSYAGWQGDTARTVDWQSGACLLIKRTFWQELSGFDPQFFFHYEEVDLCYRAAEKGYRVRFFPGGEVLHLLGQTVQRDKSRFEIEKLRNRIRYFAKHFGIAGAVRCRTASLTYFFSRFLFYHLLSRLSGDTQQGLRATMAWSCSRWLWHLDVTSFLDRGEEQDLGFEPIISHAELQRDRQSWLQN